MTDPQVENILDYLRDKACIEGTPSFDEKSEAYRALQTLERDGNPSEAMTFLEHRYAELFIKGSSSDETPSGAEMRVIERFVDYLEGVEF